MARKEKTSPDYYEILRILQGIVTEDPYIFGTCIAFKPHSFVKDSLFYAIYSWESPKGLKTKLLGNSYNYFTKDWYKIPRETGRPSWSEPDYDPGSGDSLMCTYAVPFYNEVSGKQVFKGVLTLDVSLHSLGQIVSEIKVYETGYGFLISRKGTVIYFPDTGLINRNIKDIATDFKNKKLSEIFFSPLATTGWAIGVVFPVNEVYAKLRDLAKYLLVAFGVILLMVFFVTVLTMRRLTKSFSVMLSQLQDHVRTLQQTTAEKEKIESELNIAHSIQMGMLPRESPLRSEFELFAVCVPAWLSSATPDTIHHC